MVCSPDFLKTAGSKDKKEDGDDPKGIWQIHEALVNYATLMHVLWPYHYAWLNIWRLLVEVRFGELVSADERDRAALVTRFFNAVTKENSGRATRFFNAVTKENSGRATRRRQEEVGADSIR
jgi:hypothetical protein